MSFEVTLEDTFWITFEAEDTFWTIPLEPNELPLHLLSGSSCQFLDGGLQYSFPCRILITEARTAAGPASWSCCEAKSEGFERGSVREIGLCVLWKEPCVSAS